MTAKIIDGAKVAKAMRRELAAEISTWSAQGRRPPGLAVVLVGSDAASEIYVKGKQRDCNEVGFHSIVQEGVRWVNGVIQSMRLACSAQ